MPAKIGEAETYTPPKTAQLNAQKVLMWRDEYPDEIKGMTRVGWTRANQLAKGEPLSLDIVKRMAQFNRHRKNAEIAPEFKDEPWKDAGHVAWLGWGGSEGIDWAIEISKADMQELAVAEITAASIEKVNDRELLSLNRRLHQLWGANFEGTDRKSTDGLVREDLINAYIVVSNEMKKRDIEVSDDTDLARAAQELREVYWPTLSEKDAIVVPSFVSIVGSAAKDGANPNDIDLLIRADRIDGQGGPGFFVRAEDVELPLRKRLDPGKETVPTLHWLSNPQGAHDDYVPLADLVLRWAQEPNRKIVEVGRRLAGEKVEHLQRTIDGLQARIAQMLADMEGFNEELTALETLLGWALYQDQEGKEPEFIRRQRNIYGMLGYEAEKSQLILTFIGTGAMNTRGRRGAALLIEFGGQRVQIDGENADDIMPNLSAILTTDPQAWNTKAAIAKDAQVASFNDGDLKITPNKVRHTSHDVFGYLIEADGKRVAYIPELWAWPGWAKNLDLAIIDGSAWKRDIEFAGGVGGHRALSSLVESAKERNVKRVIATHIGNPTIEALRKGDEIEGVEFADDEQIISIAELEQFLEAISPGQRYEVMKPSMAGYTEFFDTTELWEEWAADKVKEHRLLGSAKIDGFRSIISWDGKELAIWFEDAKEKKAIPNIPDLDAPSLVAEGEFTAKRNDSWLARTQLAGVAAGKLDAVPHFWLYDLLYLDGDDLSERPFSERLAALKKLQLPGEVFTVLNQKRINNKEVLARVGKWAASQSLSEGLFIRQADAPYIFGPTNTAAKMKTIAELKVEVIESTKRANGWTYHVGLREPGEFSNIVEYDTKILLDLGNTFVGPSQDVEPGDTLNVVCEELVIGEKNGQPILFWGKPTVRGPDKSRPAYTTAQAIDLARRGRILKAEVPEESSYNEAEFEPEETRAEAAARLWDENWQDLVAKGQGSFILHGHFPSLAEEESELSLQESAKFIELLKLGDKQYHSDLRMDAPSPHGAWGFTLFEGSTKNVPESGTRLADLKPDKPMRGTFKLEQPQNWLTFAKDKPVITRDVGVTGKDVAKFFMVDSGKYKLTYAREHAFEILLDGKKVKGRYQIAYVPVADGRVWMISRPENQDTTFPQEHELNTIIKELKDKKQQWLFWRATPDAPLKKIDITKMEVEEMDFTKELTKDELTAIGEAMQVGARLKRALSNLKMAMEKKDKQAALNALDEALAALEGYGYAYSYPSPTEDNGELMVGMEVKNIRASLEAARKAIEADDWEAAMKAAEELLRSYGYAYGYPEPGGDMMEIAISESGDNIQISEASTSHDAGRRGPLKMRIRLIRPGWGNKADKHYYPAEILRRDASVFEGAKMYATDHKDGEKSVRTEVSVIDRIADFAPDGSPIAEVTVFNPDFAEDVRNRADAGKLETLECSILAKGTARKGEIEGKKANIVEAITSAESVDWVTRAGAGGQALSLYESDNGRQSKLDKAIVASELSKTNLPPPSVLKLVEADYADKSELASAITKEKAELQALTRSGKPIGMGMTEQPNEQALEELEKTKAARFERIMREVGLRR